MSRNDLPAENLGDEVDIEVIKAELKKESTAWLIHLQHLESNHPVLGEGEIHPDLVALRARLLREAAPEDRPALEERIQKVLDDTGPAMEQGRRERLVYLKLLREELSTRPHIRRPGQERKKRQENARKNRGQGKSKNR